MDAMKAILAGLLIIDVCLAMYEKHVKGNVHEATHYLVWAVLMFLAYKL